MRGASWHTLSPEKKKTNRKTRQQNPTGNRGGSAGDGQGGAGAVGSVVVSRGAVGHQPGDASCSAGVGMCRGWGSTEGRGAPVTTLLTRPRLPLAEAGLGAAGAGREEAELHPTAVPLPAGGACLPTLHPGALRALPGPLPLPAPEENEGESLSDPSTPPEGVPGVASACSCACPIATQPRAGAAVLWGCP